MGSIFLFVACVGVFQTFLIFNTAHVGAIGIIGGADGPTAIYTYVQQLTNGFGFLWLIAAAVVVLAAVAIMVRKKRSR